MKTLEKGQKISLQGYKLKFLGVGIKWNQNDFPDYEIDSGVIMLSEHNKLENKDDFIFYNNLESRCGGVKKSEAIKNGYKKKFSLNFEKISDNVSNLIFILNINNGNKLNHKFGNIKDIEIELIDEEKNEILYTYQLDTLTSETAIMIAEIYKYKNEWKIKATGNGFYGGLDNILSEYASENVQVAEIILSKTNENMKEKDLLIEKPSISLTKITLQKKGDSTKIFLGKGETKLDNIHIKLFWKKGVDLDLYAFYSSKNGKSGQVYFMNKGSLKKEPFIELDQDAGVGNLAGDNEENLKISTLEPLNTILIAVNIFRFFGIFSKGENFAKYDGVVVINTNRGDEIKVPLTSEELGQWFVILKIDNGNPYEPRIVNINQVLKNKPTIEQFNDF